MVKKLEQLSKTIIILSGIGAMIWIIGIAIFSPNLGNILSEFRSESTLNEIVIQNLTASIIAIFLIGCGFYISKVKISFKASNIIAVIESILFFIFLLWLFRYLGIQTPIDDGSFVLNIAKEVVETGKISGWYLAANPQNLFILFVYIFIDKVFGSFDHHTIYIIFSIMHAVSALLIYFSAKKLTNKPMASLIAMNLFMFTIQISLHVANIYTDTLSIFTSLIMVIFFVYFIQTKNFNKKIVYLTLSSIFLSISFFAKGLFLILFIAVVIALIVGLSGKEKWLVLIPIVTFLLLNVGWNKGIDALHLYEIDERGMPNTHYLFMGANAEYYFKDDGREHYRSAGGYNDNDLAFSKDLFWDQRMSKSTISKMHLELIKERWSSLSLTEALAFLNAKNATTWSSGDLKSTFSIKLAAEHNEVSSTLATSKGFNLYMQTIQMIYYFILLLVFIKMLIKRTGDLYSLLTCLFLVGMFLFLLLWEASPRYSMTIMSFIPILFPYLITTQKKTLK
ncbi:glycosyltransferase family 39 protein [Carnobacterium sp. CS13]|uniref:ArnT family glycosyltransferase n=1 Tax=Carnobacterium sp. CS13 TaxID=2800128 RepID=UPI00191208E6|nr:glycosyltransferase family 39 protein [Carnobacterium sp. CS13]QQP69582.1 glycosyltransferase family 39 protein [Carnobacterium sp. CS13]